MSLLKQLVAKTREPKSHFFERATLKFWGDSVNNYRERNDLLPAIKNRYSDNETVQGASYCVVRIRCPGLVPKDSLGQMFLFDAQGYRVHTEDTLNVSDFVDVGEFKF